jgi:DNA polymerase III epsilon subunit-like protein
MVYLCYDFETNGINAMKCGIMQMAIMDLEGRVIMNRYMFPYDNKIDAVEIHGIDENKLKEKNAKPSFETMEEMIQMIEHEYRDEPIDWIAYNNFGYDQIVMEAELKRMGKVVPDNWNFIDLFPCMKEVFPDIQPNYKLKTVYEYMFGKGTDIQYHCALADTSCLVKMYNKLEEMGYERLLRDKYRRCSFMKNDIMQMPISVLSGYSITYEMEEKGIFRIDDFYREFIKREYDISKMNQFMKNISKVKTHFWIQQMTNQLETIRQFQTKKRKERS